MADDQETLARLKDRLARVENERKDILIAIRVVEGGRGDIDLASAADEPEAGEITSAPPQPPPVRRGEPIRPDTFFGMTQHQAARRYLQGVGHADRIENILKTILAGGVEVGGANPLDTLRATLGQNTSTFVKVSPGTFGLREFYPHLGNKDMAATARKTAARKRPKSGAKKAPRKPGKPQAKAKAKPKAESPPKEKEGG
jgi:hypothetical protein